MERIVAYIKEKIKSKYSDYLTIKNEFKGLEKGIKEYSDEICKETIKSILEATRIVYSNRKVPKKNILRCLYEEM